jgi:hypothetical protein
MDSGSSRSFSLFTSPESVPDNARDGSPRAPAPAADPQPAAHRMLPPPHGRRFPTEEAAEMFLKHFSSTAGYKIVRKRSAAKGKDGRVIAYVCHLSGQPRGDVRTKKIGCPFRISVDCLKRTNYEYEINTYGTRAHNHGPEATKSRKYVPAQCQRIGSLHDIPTRRARYSMYMYLGTLGWAKFQVHVST